MNLPDNPTLISFLNNLFDTNADFANEHDDKFFETFKEEQNPRLTILKCSDSRVQMESFDKTPQNGVFAVRNIGNQILTSEGSVDFGVTQLKTPFLLIVGHSGCGAVQLALSKGKTNLPAIDREIESIKLQSTTPGAAIVENVNFQVTRAMEKYKDLIESGSLTVLGAVYDFKNDFSFGKGKVVLININGITDAETIKAKYADSVSNLHFVNANQT